MRHQGCLIFLAYVYMAIKTETGIEKTKGRMVMMFTMDDRGYWHLSVRSNHGESQNPLPLSMLHLKYKIFHTEGQPSLC
jgi:hypothetical protein